MRIVITFFISFCLMWASDGALRAYLTSSEFEVVGLLYTFDFNKNGVIDHDEYLLLKDKNLYHIDLQKGFGSSLIQIDMPVERASFAGYIVKEPQKGFHLLLSSSAEVLRIDNGRFEALASDLTYEIENDRAAIVYKNFARFKNIVASFDTPGFAWSLSKEGDVILIADGQGGVVALDKDLAKTLWSYRIDGSVFCVLPLGDERYALGTSSGLYEFQKRDFLIANSFFPDSYVSKLLKKGQNVLALVEHKGLYRVKKENFAAKKIAPFIADPQDFSRLGDALVVADGNKGLMVLSKPPQKLSDRDDIKSVAVIGSRYIAILPWQSKYFLLYDRDTKKVKEFREESVIENIVVSKNLLTLLYKASYIDRVRLGSSGEVVWQKRIFLPYPATDVLEDENFLYVTIGGGGIVKIVK